MVQILDRVWVKGLSLWASEKGQGVFEYVMLLGGLSALIVLALVLFAAPAANGMIHIACAKIASIPVFSSLTCPA